MLKKFLILCGILLGSIVTAQKDTREIFSAENINSININTDEVYLINIITSDASQIEISTHSEGEYYDDILVESSITGDQLNIRTEYPQRLAGGYDKLSAHKVFSLEIELRIPGELEVAIRSNIASVQSKGGFKSLHADLKQGYCKLLDFSGIAVINTYSGNILVETASGLIEASSRNGRVEVPDFLPGRNPLRLTSIDGNIMVRKN
ncbi:hypothetical protein GCM10023115_35830 [Pontixanthobacter gangjinensis]|uniref:DUF4097 domain-containing protein n=1 Tax=Christiangramia aestuarii TaxID=1028746 RepID=A0A7K1LS00_9FLAO|nr:hypothetical protein [Christiangramia aestuarii]MUP43250.1 hypothetical protein [Christiangramia aestuarii]